MGRSLDFTLWRMGRLPGTHGAAGKARSSGRTLIFDPEGCLPCLTPLYKVPALPAYTPPFRVSSPA